MNAQNGPSESPYNSNVIVLGLTSMVSTFCISLWQAYLSPYFASLGMGNISVGLYFTYGAIATVLAYFVSGWLGDRYGRKTVIVFSTIGVAVASALMSFTLALTVLLGFLLLSWSSTSLQPNLRALITDSVSKGYRGRALGVFNSLGVALASLAIIISGIYLNTNNIAEYSSKLPILLIISSIIVSLVAVFRQAWLYETIKPSGAKLKSLLTGNMEVLTHDKLRLITIAYMIHDAGLSVVLFLIPLYAVYYLHMQSYLLAVMLALNYLITFVLQTPFGRLADSWGRTKVIVLSFFIEAFAIGGLWLLNSIYYLILMYGVWVAIGQLDLPAEGALLADLSPQEKRATVMGGFGGVTTIAAVPAPILGGYLSSMIPGFVGGYALPFIVAFVILLISTFLALYYRAKIYSG